MPRVRPLIKQDPRKTAILQEIGGIMAALHLTQNELANRAGIAPSTMSKRMKQIGNMRLRELWAIRDTARKAGLPTPHQNEL